MIRESTVIELKAGWLEATLEEVHDDFVRWPEWMKREAKSGNSTNENDESE